MVPHGFTVADRLNCLALSLLRSWKRSAVDEDKECFWAQSGHKCLQHLPDGPELLYIFDGKNQSRSFCKFSRIHDNFRLCTTRRNRTIFGSTVSLCLAMTSRTTALSWLKSPTRSTFRESSTCWTQSSSFLEKRTAKWRFSMFTIMPVSRSDPTLCWKYNQAADLRRH